MHRSCSRASWPCTHDDEHAVLLNRSVVQLIVYHMTHDLILDMSLASSEALPTQRTFKLTSL